MYCKNCGGNIGESPISGESTGCDTCEGKTEPEMREEQTFEDKLKYLQETIAILGLKVEPYETSGGALIVVTNVETGMEIGYRKL